MMNTSNTRYWNRLLENTLREVMDSHLLMEISTDDAYARYYSQVPMDYYELIKRLFSNKGKMNPMVKFWLDAYNPDIAAWQATRFWESWRGIKDSDIHRELMDSAKKCHSVNELLQCLNFAKCKEDERMKGETLENMLCRISDNIVAPLTFAASEKLYDGRTNWCTAKDEDSFYKYCDIYRWIVVINGVYQICINRNGKIEEFRDDEDEDVIHSPDYFLCGEIDGVPVNHDQIMQYYQEWLDSDEGSDDFYCDFLIGKLDYEKFHGTEWKVDFNREFIDLFGKEAYNKIMQALPGVIKKGMQFLEDSMS